MSILSPPRTWHRRPLSLPLVLALLAAGPLPARAAADAEQFHPNLARGRSAAPTYAFPTVDLDRVNLFNGNLSIALPLGIEYPVGSALGYRFTLHYNSRAWDVSRDAAGALRADPLAASNAGFGWDLSFGRLLSPGSPGNPGTRWTYVAPDGGLHPFFPTLHPGGSENDPGDSTQYSRDGSYLRLRHLSGGERIVEEPDGVQRRFVPNGADYRLSEVTDPFGDRLAISYGLGGDWTLTDSHGRSHRVVFQNDPTGTYPALVASVELAAFGATTAVYSFNYTTVTATRDCLDGSAETPATAVVPVLASITRPDGGSWSFVHDASANCKSSGRFTLLTLPDGGGSSYAYGNYSFADAAAVGSLSAELSSVSGVTRRSTVDRGGTVVGSWNFSGWLVRLDGTTTAGQPAVEAVRRVADPAGNPDLWYFSVFAGSPQGAYDPSAYGLPGTSRIRDGSGTRYLERRLRTCTAGVCTDVQRSYLRWESDGPCTPADASCLAVNRRQASTRTEYRDDPNPLGGFHHWTVDRSDFDGLGHYRSESDSGSFGGPTRLATTTFDAGAGSYPSAGWTMPAPSDPWVLTTFSSQTVSEGGETLVSDFCHDAATGFLLRRRDRETAVRGPRDVIVAFTAGTGGQVTDERYYGADVQTVSTATNLCSLALPAKPVYHRRRTWQAGALQTKRWVDPSTGAAFAFTLVDRTIDPSTGLPSAERDETGLETEVAHDALGRLVLRRPPAGEGARLDVTYTPATALADARTTSTWTDQSSGAVLHQEEERQDAFGRLAEERRQLPGGGWSVRETEYSPTGYRSRVAVPHLTGGAAAWVEFLDLDVLGRPGRLRRADGAEVGVAYRGTREVEESWIEAVYHLGESYPPESRVASAPHTRTSTFDRNGRRLQIQNEFTNNQNQPRSDVLVYSYDAAGHRLSTFRDGMGLGHRLHYDGRGFLVLEEPLEAELEAVTHSQHDPLGQAGRTVESDFDLTWMRDAAGRLVEIHATAEPGRVYKRFTYADSNLAGRGRTRGRVVASERRLYRDEYADRWFFAGDVVIGVSQDYAGPGGRLSKRVTTVSDLLADRYGLTQSWSWSPLGEPTTVTYPRWTVTYPGVAQPPNRTVTYTYDHGLPVTAGGTWDGPMSPSGQPGWVDSVQYDAAGQPETIVHANGVHDHWTFDSAARVATANLTHTWDNDTWLSGTHLYDGGGTLYQIGDRYQIPEFNSQGIATPTDDPTEPLCEGLLDPFGLALTVGDSTCGGDWIVLFDADDRAVLEYALDPSSGAWRGYLTGFDHRDRPLRTLEVSWAGYKQPASLLTVEDRAYLADRQVGRAELTVAYGSLRLRHLHANGAPESNEIGNLMYDVAYVPSAGLSTEPAPLAKHVPWSPDPGPLDSLAWEPEKAAGASGLPILGCLLEAADQPDCSFIGNHAIPPSRQPSCQTRVSCFQECADCCSALPGPDSGSLLQKELEGICTAVLTGTVLRVTGVRLWLETRIKRFFGRFGLRTILRLCRQFRESQFEEIRNCNQECSHLILSESCAPNEEDPEDEEGEEEGEGEGEGEEKPIPSGTPRGPSGERKHGPRNNDVPPPTGSGGGGGGRTPSGTVTVTDPTCFWIIDPPMWVCT